MASNWANEFGFRRVEGGGEKKEEMVHGVFSSVASSYDRMNDAMSLGIHRLWKDRFVSRLLRDASHTPLTLLDVAGGTGDIAFRMLARNQHPQTRLTCVDINEEMLRAGQLRPEAQDKRIAFHVGNAEVLEGVEDASMDIYTIAFGIRNCSHIPRVLEQAHRVLRPGGIFSCLEFGKVWPPPLAALYHRYSFSVIPILGQLIAADRDSYQYLVESIHRFPQQEEFARMIATAGFELPGKGYEDLSFGVAAIHTGVKVT